MVCCAPPIRYLLSCPRLRRPRQYRSILSPWRTFEFQYRRTCQYWVQRHSRTSMVYRAPPIRYLLSRRRLCRMRLHRSILCLLRGFHFQRRWHCQHSAQNHRSPRSGFLHGEPSHRKHFVERWRVPFAGLESVLSAIRGGRAPYTRCRLKLAGVSLPARYFELSALEYCVLRQGQSHRAHVMRWAAKTPHSHLGNSGPILIG